VCGEGEGEGECWRLVGLTLALGVLGDPSRRSARKDEDESTKEQIGDMFSALWFGCTRVFPTGAASGVGVGSPDAPGLLSPPMGLLSPPLGRTPSKGGMYGWDRVCC
jgi:hypothetical protein